MSPTSPTPQTAAADPATTASPLLEVDSLRVDYRQRGWRRPPFRAVDGVSFTVEASETLAIVGESGSGKSTIARAILGLVRPTAGTIRFGGQDVTHLPYRRRRPLARELSAVFQDPYSSLNPARKVADILAEPLQVQGRGRREAAATVTEMLTRVGLPADAGGRYPRQFSGGQRQRIAIARALTVAPRLVVCDEPVSALDLSTQAQVINLLTGLQEQLSIAMLFVSHDLSVVRHVAHRSAVVLRGQVMEIGPAAAVHADPAHPYTQALLAAAPVPDPAEQARRRAVRQQADSGAQSGGARTAARGCPFTPRCPHRMDVCASQRPALTALPSGVQVACHLFTGATTEQPEEPQP